MFLLTLLAASLLALLGPDRRAAPAPAAPANVAQDAPREPLAELGVAPGNAPKTPAPAPARAPQPLHH